MKHVFGLALLVATFPLGPAIAQDAAVALRDAPAPAIAPRGLPVGTCINMGNSLEPEQEGSWGGTRITAADFERIAAAGFDTVRIPVRWHNKSLSEPPYTVEPAWMDRVAQVVDEALAADLNVILNSHHFDPIHENPLGVAEWHGAVWDQIAQRFAPYPEARLWFELENEPHNKFDNGNLVATLAPALEAVRDTNPTRPVIYGGEMWSGVDSLATLPLPDDPNVYPTFHYYEPFDFTHQGAEWVAPDIPPPGRRYGSEADGERLARDVAKVERYMERTGLRPFMGETGAYDKHVSAPERAAYHRAVREAFAPTGIGICTWAYSNTFPFYDPATGDWVPGMLDAMGLADRDDTAAPDAAAPVRRIDAVAARKPPRNRKLTPELQALDEALPGDLVNDPASLDWESYGDAVKRSLLRDASIPGGGAALRFAVMRAGDAYSAGANIPVLADIRESDTITVGFWARAAEAEATGGTGTISVRFQQNRPPYPGFGDRTLSIGPQWRFYEVTAVADRDVSRRDAIVSLQFGGLEQTVEIGQAIVVTGAASIAG